MYEHENNLTHKIDVSNIENIENMGIVRNTNMTRSFSNIPSTRQMGKLSILKPQNSFDERSKLQERPYKNIRK